MQESGGEGWRRRLAMSRDAVMVAVGLGLVVWVVGMFLSRVANVVLVLCLALVFEMLLSPLVDRLSRYWGRGWAVLAVVFAAFVTVVGGGAFLIALLTTQIAHLVDRLPHDLAIVSVHIPGFLHTLKRFGFKVSVGSIEGHLIGSLGNISKLVGNLSRAVLTRLVDLVTNVVDSVVESAITIFVTIYLLVDAERIHAAVLRLVPPRQREGFLAVEHTLGRVVGGYVRGQLALSSIVGLAFGLGCWLIGLPYPLLIGILAAIMELIPLLGPVLGAILPVVLALFSGRLWVEVPEVLVLLALVHLIESQLLGPRIIRQQVGLHPVLSVVALMIGADLWGVWGALFAVPAAGIIVAGWVAGVRVWREKVVVGPAEGPAEAPLAPPVGLRKSSHE